MSSKKRMISVFCAIAVMILCSVNMTYAWENLYQTALNVNMGGTDSGNTGDSTDKDPSGTIPPSKDDKEPDKNPNPGQNQNPSPGTSGGSSGGDTTNGNGQLSTGDKCEFVFYMVIMLISFTIAVALGALLIALAVNEWEKRRKRRVM